MWLAIEGGALYAQHQRVQSAADIAALVGAQDLPCSATDTSCINQAESDACTYAAKNGFSCTAGAATGAGADVPPTSCSPYNFIDYGNGATNSKCASAPAASTYYYVEVHLTWSVANVPIFNIPVSFSVHAVARRSTTGHNNFALMALQSGGIRSTGTCPSTDCPTGIVIGSVYSQGPTNGDGADYSCGGEWYSNSTINNVWTTGSSNVTYAPMSCGGAAKTCPGGGSGGSGDCGGGGTGQALTNPNGPTIPDPYAESSPPQQMSTCPECSQPGWWLDLDAKTWHQGGTPVGSGVTKTSKVPYCSSTSSIPCAFQLYSGCSAKTGTAYADVNFSTGCSAWKHCATHVEMFPGIYNTLPSTTPDNCVYMNPGVYTFDEPVNPSTTTSGDADQHNSIVCIFGSPSCDTVDSGGDQIGTSPSSHTPGYNCDSAWFTNSSDGGNKFEYQCSPWGFWDGSTAIRSSPYKNAPTTQQLPLTGPTYYNSETSSWTNVPLNGVVLYFPQNSLNPNNEALYTESGASTLVILAAPNPCPGTGTGAVSGSAPVPDQQTTGSVPFPQGSSSATYTYASDDVVSQHGQAAGQKYDGVSNVYATNDYTEGGECGLPYEAWPNELPDPQRVQFLVYETGPMSNTFYGTDDMIFYGLFYDPQGSLNFTGKFGSEGADGSPDGDSGAEGAPWLNGQAVVGTVNLTNAASLQIAYISCTGTNVCPSGSGEQLVQ